MTIQKRNTKESLLEAAEIQFSISGYYGTSIREIARYAGTNSAMINYHFDSKEGLYIEIFNTRFKEFRSVLLQTCDDSSTATQKLHDFLSEYIHRLMRNRHFHMLLKRELLDNEVPTVKELVTENACHNLQLLRKLISEGIYSGEFKEVDEELIALNILTLVPSVMTEYYIMPKLLNLNFEGLGDQKIAIERLVNHFLTFLKA